MPPSYSVLLVEDHRPLRALNGYLLEQDDRFHVVGEAEDGHEAIQLAERLQPDLILLDLAMPVMDGLEALPRIRAVAPKAKIVVLSMLQRDGIEQEALRLGATAFLDKGLGSEEFVQRLRSLLEDSERPSSKVPVPRPKGKG